MLVFSTADLVSFRFCELFIELTRVLWAEGRFESLKLLEMVFLVSSRFSVLV